MKIKKIIYILLTMFLGFLLATIAHAFIEMWILKTITAYGLIPQEYVFLGTHCFLPPYLQFGLIAFGLLGGYFTGQAWWCYVYVEHRCWRNKKKS